MNVEPLPSQSQPTMEAWPVSCVPIMDLFYWYIMTFQWRTPSGERAQLFLLLWSLQILRIYCRNLRTHTHIHKRTHTHIHGCMESGDVWGRGGGHYSLQTFHEYKNRYSLIDSAPVLKCLLEQRWILWNAEKSRLVLIMYQVCCFIFF